MRCLFVVQLFINFSIHAAIVPPPLQKGDTIAIVAPGKPTDLTEFNQSLEALKRLGYKIKLAPNLMDKWGYLAGRDQDRAEGLMASWRDPEVKMIWCMGGGYGSARILDRIDYDYIKKHPKIFIGMSDITALHAAIGKNCDLVTYLGPVLRLAYGGKEKNVFTIASIWRAVQQDPLLYIQGFEWPKKSFATRTLSPGIAKGPLVGGTLSIIASLMGTPYQLDTEGKIVVIEEVGEQPYQIDRMLQQLKMGGLLDKPAGVLLATFSSCHSVNPENSLTVDQVLKDYFANAPYPVLIGFPSGHIPDQLTLPLNQIAELDASKQTLRLVR